MNFEEQPDGAKQKKKVLVVDDHPIVRLGLSKLIDQESDFVVCGTAEGAPEALADAQELQPDVAVVDWSLKNDDDDASELITTLCRRHSKIPVLVLSIHEELFYAERALRAGARGYIMKQEAADKIVEAIRCVAAGQTYLSPRAASMVATTDLARLPAEKAVLLQTLMPMEMDTLHLIAIGFSSSTIMGLLGWRLKDFNAVCDRLKAKLRLCSMTELYQTAARWVAEAYRDGHEA